MHKNMHDTALTKADLRTLYETRTDLVSRASSMGAEIPITSMHWKHVAHDLEWIVLQMSWPPPWTSPKEAGPKLPQRRKTSTAVTAANVPLPHVPSQQTPLAAATGNIPRQNTPHAPAAPAEVKQEEHSDADGSGAESCESSACAASDGEQEPPQRESVAQTPEHTKPAHSTRSEKITDPLPHPRTLWSEPSKYIVDDDFGYGRIPAFWFTLHLPYNYLYEIHRFSTPY